MIYVQSLPFSRNDFHSYVAQVAFSLLCAVIYNKRKVSKWEWIELKRGSQITTVNHDFQTKNIIKYHSNVDIFRLGNWNDVSIRSETGFNISIPVDGQPSVEY